MELLQAGVDCLHAHIRPQGGRIGKLTPYQAGKKTRFRPNDRLLAFLEAL